MPFASVDGNICINNTEIGSGLCFDQAKILGSIEIGILQENNVSIGASNKGGISMRGATISGRLAIQNARILGDIDGTRSVINGDLRLGSNGSNGNEVPTVDTSEAFDLQKLYAYEPDFSLRILPSGVQVFGSILFQGFRLSGALDCINCQCDGGIDFSEGSISLHATFRGLNVSGNLILTDTAIGGELDFSDPKKSNYAMVPLFVGGRISIGRCTIGGSVTLAYSKIGFRRADDDKHPAIDLHQALINGSLVTNCEEDLELKCEHPSKPARATVIVGGDINGERSKILNEVRIEYLDINENILFAGAEIGGAFSVRRYQSSYSVSSNPRRLNQVVNLSDSRIGDFIVHVSAVRPSGRFRFCKRVFGLNSCSIVQNSGLSYIIDRAVIRDLRIHVGKQIGRLQIERSISLSLKAARIDEVSYSGEEISSTERLAAFGKILRWSGAAGFNAGAYDTFYRIFSSQGDDRMARKVFNSKIWMGIFDSLKFRHGVLHFFESLLPAVFKTAFQLLCHSGNNLSRPVSGWVIWFLFSFLFIYASPEAASLRVENVVVPLRHNVDYSVLYFPDDKGIRTGIYTSWNYAGRFWMTLRAHLPLIDLAARRDWKFSANPLRIGRLSIKAITYEDYSGFVQLSTYIFTPLFLLAWANSTRRRTTN